MLRKINDFVSANPFAVFAAMAFLVTGVHLLTVAEYPPAWFDEIEILEIGRFSLFDIKPEWSVNLMASPDGTLTPPFPFFHYLAGAVLEALYRLTGGFICGRILMLLSLPFCALALLAYLREKGIRPKVAFVVASLFLIDPNATICAHWYRPDLWCMAMVFVSLTLMMRSRTSPRPMLPLFAGGVLAAASVFFWITSVLFLPLVLLEFYLSYCKSGDRPPVRILPRFLALSAGGVVATAVLLAPLLTYIPEILSQYLTNSEVGSIAAASDAPLSAALRRLCDFVKIVCRSPFTWFAAAVGMFHARRRMVYAAILFVALALFIVATRVYHLRMVYLMPYVFLFTAVAAERMMHSESRLVAILSRAYFVGALIFGASLSVAALNFAALPETNTLSLLAQKLKAAIPAKNPKVCLVDFEHEFYYAGRRLGWKLYSTSARLQMLEEPYAALLDTMDAVIVSSMLSPLPDDSMERTLRAHGFTDKTEIDMPPPATGRIKPFLAAVFYAHGYPSFTVWTKAR